MDKDKPKVVTLYRVEAEHFVAGLEVVEGKIEHAAPILAWANGMKSKDFWKRAQKKGWEIKEVAMYSRQPRSTRTDPSGIESQVTALKDTRSD